MIAPLLDTEVSFATFCEAFGVDDDRPWPVPVYVFRDGAVLVDTGFGPPGADPFVEDREAHLDELLDPADIELVVLTHLHVDHVGWNMHDGAPFFPNARYVAHLADYEYFTTTRGDRPYVHDQIVALQETGRLELVDRDTEVGDGVGLRHAPGHTPGHCIVDLGTVVVLGDLAVHELQLADPGLAYVSEADQVLAAETRRRILQEVEGRPVAISHLGVGRVEPEGEGFRWVASK
jgi:glyoxylase-like metal-dependent hydrolase (beta-lactamase superfamily II)